MKKIRMSNFELMRTVAMIMVTMLHALGHGGVLESYEFGSAGYIVMWIIETLSNVSVNLFVLITGFFMINSNFKISKIIKLATQVEFYSIICLVITKFVLHKPISNENIIRAIFPLTGNIYWFASAYAVLLCLSPLLNNIIHSINKTQHLELCILLGVVFSIIPTIFFWSKDFITGGSTFTWFIVLYFTAAYIRRYSDSTSFLKYSKEKYFLFYIVFCLLAVSSLLILGEIGIILGEPKLAKILYSYNSIIFYGASICLFMFFKQIEISNNFLSKVTVEIGSVCFGAYLYSDNPFLRKPLWDFVNLPQMVKNAKWGGIACILASVLIIFLIGCLIECIRSCIFNVFGISKLIYKIDTAFEKYIEKVKLYCKKI